MAITDKTDNIIYNAEFSEGYMETVNQAVEELSTGLNGAFNIVTAESMGDYRKTRFFDWNQGEYGRRDVEDTSTAITPNGMTQGEVIGPKLSRRFGPLQFTAQHFHVGFNTYQYSFSGFSHLQAPASMRFSYAHSTSSYRT